MYIIDLTYKVNLTVVEKHLQQHREYLDEHFSSSVFLSSGAKVPRTGGVIIATCDNKQALLRIIKEDPFYKNNIADYSITEYLPSKGILKDINKGSKG